MFGRTLMTLGLAMLLAAPAHAGFGLVLPDSPIVDDPEKTSLNLVICAIDPATGAGIPIERPQVFTALRYSGDNMDRSEHLSVLDEVVAYGARAWTTNISLPHPGVYQLVMQTKGMAFSGQALFDGTPIPGALIDVARLDPAIKPNVAQPEDPNAPPQDDKAQPKAKKQDKQPTPQPISAFGATQQVKADSQGVFTFVCPLPGWWAFSTSMAGDPLQDPEGKQKPLEIKTIFWVYMNDCPKTAPSKK